MSNLETFEVWSMKPDSVTPTTARSNRSTMPAAGKAQMSLPLAGCAREAKEDGA